MEIVLIIILGVFLYYLYDRKITHVEVSELSNSEKFIEELFNKFGYDAGTNCGFNHVFLERPKTKETIQECKLLCEKYGYNYYMLFKNIKRPFIKTPMYDMCYYAWVERGTLTLVPLKEGESNLKHENSETNL